MNNTQLQKKNNNKKYLLTFVNVLNSNIINYQIRNIKFICIFFSFVYNL